MIGFAIFAALVVTTGYMFSTPETRAKAREETRPVNMFCGALAAVIIAAIVLGEILK